MKQIKDLMPLAPWLLRFQDKQVATILYSLILYSPGVMPVSFFKNLEKNETDMMPREL